MVIGLSLAALAGILYYISLLLVSSPLFSMTVLLAGRGILGAGESFIITGALTWGIVRTGAEHTGMVMSWVGTAMYIAYAVGAPLGTLLFGRLGFSAIALATIVLPLAALGFVLPLTAVKPVTHTKVSLRKVVKAVSGPGLGLALSSIGFGAITTFIVLLFAQKGWQQAWLAFTLLSVCFMLGRICFGHLPDKLGGAKVAMACILIEALGQACIWLAPVPIVALAGAGLTGLGYALVYPALGVEAVRAVAPEQRGVAMGAYTAFLDLALGLSGPLLGLAAGFTSMQCLYGISGLLVLSAGLVVYKFVRPRN